MTWQDSFAKWKAVNEIYWTKVERIIELLKAKKKSYKEVRNAPKDAFLKG